MRNLIKLNSTGVDDKGASLADPKDISTYSHMFSCWESLFIIKEAMELAGYRSVADKTAFVEAMESLQKFDLGLSHPQGNKIFNPKLHQSFGHQHISKVSSGGVLDVVHTTSIEDGIYESDVDYTKMAL